MKFVRRLSTYSTLYTKKQAEKELLKDERIDIINSNKNQMIVFTNPITPKPTMKKYKNFFLCPIGRYEIIIDSNNSKLNINIKLMNNNVYTYVHHSHINYSWCYPICWGNASSEVNTIFEENDWYWLVKRALDLLEDGNPEKGNYDLFYNVMTKLMYQYAYQNNYKKKMLKDIMKIRYNKFKKEGKSYCEGFLIDLERENVNNN